MRLLLVAVALLQLPWCAGAVRLAQKMASQQMLDSDLDAGSNATGPSYVIDMLRLKQNGYQKMFCGLSADGCKTLTGYPGNNVVNEMTWQVVVEQMQKVPEKQEQAAIVRGNELGYLILNSKLWERDFKTMGIGGTVEQHKFIRPFLDALLGKDAEGKIWSREMIAKDIETFFTGRVELDTTRDVNIWATKLLHKIHLKITLTDEEAQEFSDFQSEVVPKVPDYPDFVHLFMGWPALQDKRDKWLQKYMEAIKIDDRGIFPSDMSLYTGSKLKLLASNIMDSLLFAGGLSIPGALTAGLAVLHTKASPWKDTIEKNHAEGRKSLTSENAEEFAYEVLRLFPAVVGFPWWSPNRQRRTVMNIAMALRDPSTWGDDSLEFKLRGLPIYEDKARVAWAEPANGPEAYAVKAPGRTGHLTPMSRGCPAQALSIVMLTEFFKAWSSRMYDWRVLEAPAEGVSFVDVTPFAQGKLVLAEVAKEGWLRVDFGGSWFGYNFQVCFVQLLRGSSTRAAELRIYKTVTSDRLHENDDTIKGEGMPLTKEISTKTKESSKYGLAEDIKCFKVYGKSTYRFCGVVPGEETRSEWLSAIKDEAKAAP